MADRRLELDWPNKEMHVVFDPDTRRPGWVAALDGPGPLLETAAYGTGDNLLVRGDNLQALRALERTHAGRVRLAYLDPPYNTGSAFAHYDDGFEHSLWLTMIRDRLEAVRRLLRDDGALFIEIDDAELGYLRVLLDDIFGRPNYITTISVRRSAATGHKAINPGLVNVTEYILVYARDKAAWRYNPQLVLRTTYDKSYNLFIPNRDDPPPAWRFEPLGRAAAGALGFTGPDAAAAARRALGKAAFDEAYVSLALAHAPAVVRYARPEYDRVGQAARDLIDRSRAEPDRVHRLERPGYSDMYFYRGNRVLFLADKLADTGEGHGIAEPMTNFWDDIPWQGIAREGGVDFPKGKKPERLLRRIIHLATDPGDLVLDSFAGSGTTGAVAHREGRRWIMVEMGEQAETHILPRLQAVLNECGGGFRYCRLGPPLALPDPATGVPALNPCYTGDLLVQAVCTAEGFNLTGGEPLHGRRGDVFAHVTAAYVTQAYADAVAAALPPGGSLTIYAPRLSGALRLPGHVSTRKVPRDLRG